MKSQLSHPNIDIRFLEEFGQFRRVLNLHFTNALRSLSLGVKQAQVLRFLAKRGKASLAELSRDTLTDPAAMTRVITVLLKQNILIQKKDILDKRRWELALTARGQKLAGEVEKIYLFLSKKVLENLSVEEKLFFTHTLQKLSNSLKQKKMGLDEIQKKGEKNASTRN